MGTSLRRARRNTVPDHVPYSMSRTLSSVALLAWAGLAVAVSGCSEFPACVEGAEASTRLEYRLVERIPNNPPNGWRDATILQQADTRGAGFGFPPCARDLLEDGITIEIAPGVAVPGSRSGGQGCDTHYCEIADGFDAWRRDMPVPFDTQDTFNQSTVCLGSSLGAEDAFLVEVDVVQPELLESSEAVIVLIAAPLDGSEACGEAWVARPRS